MDPNSKDPNSKKEDKKDVKVETRVVITSKIENNKTMKQKLQIVKELNKDGKYETKKIPVKEQTVKEQIDEKKLECAEYSEVIRKLQAQKANLQEQVKMVTELVNERMAQAKKEEKERIENQFRAARNKKAELVAIPMEQKEVDKRIKELEQELRAATKYGEVLATEIGQLKSQNKKSKDADELSGLLSQIEEHKKQLEESKKQKSYLEAESSRLAKKISELEKKDGTKEFNITLLELQSIKDKLRKLDESQLKDSVKFEEREEQVKKYIEELKRLKEELNEEDPKDPDPPNLEKAKYNPDLAAKIEAMIAEREENKLFSYRDVGLDQAKYLKKKKEKQEEKLKQEEQKEQKLRDQINKAKGVRDLINLKQDYSKLKPTIENFEQLCQKILELKEIQKKKAKKQAQELQKLETDIYELKQAIGETSKKIKEQEREKLLIAQLLSENQVEWDRHAEEKKKHQTKQLSPLRPVKTTTQELLEKKKVQLEKNKTKLEEKNNTRPNKIVQEPFKITMHYERRTKEEKRLEREKEKDQTMMDKMIDCGHRVAERVYFIATDANDQSRVLDDIQPLGSASTFHRLFKIKFYFSPKEPIFYLINSEYVKEDKKTLVVAEWNLNKEILAGKGENFQTETLELGLNDRIREVVLRKENGFISFIQITTKQKKVFKVGKEVIEEEKEKPKPEEGKDEKKGGEKSVQETDPDKFVLKVNPQQVLNTLFGAYSQRAENEWGLSVLGFELARKLSPEEKEEYRQQRVELQKARLLEKNKKLLEQSIAAEKNKKLLEQSTAGIKK